MWKTFPSNYRYFRWQSSCLLLLLEVCKNHYKKENISAGGSEQRRDALFWIPLRQTWLNLFGLILIALSFSTFIFSIGINLFARHPVVPFGILILLEQVDDFVQLPPWCILKDRQLCLHKYLKYWVLYIPLSLRQNKSRYKIWHCLELGCSCKWKLLTNKKM